MLQGLFGDDGQFDPLQRFAICMLDQAIGSRGFPDSSAH